MKSAGIIAAGWGERLGQKIPKALTPVGQRKLIDFALDGFEASGITHVTCIVNEAAQAVPEYVIRSNRKLTMDWIIQTTPSSMHSFLIVLERLKSVSLAGRKPGSSGANDTGSRSTTTDWRTARQGSSGGRLTTCGDDDKVMITTVDSVCPPRTYQTFLRTCGLFPEADVCLGITKLIDDEKPLRVAMRGTEGTGILPERLSDDPSAYEIVALTNNGFQSDFVTAGFYGVSTRILTQKDAALRGGYNALRQLLGHLLKYGHRFYAIPLADVVDVDRPEDISTAEALINS